MTERAICIKKGAALDWDHYDPDPDAPSVSEVVEALIDARNASEGEDKRWGGKTSARTQRLADLIARLDGGET